jgi:hypothetical protein
MASSVVYQATEDPTHLSMMMAWCVHESRCSHRMPACETRRYAHRWDGFVYDELVELIL